MVDVPRRLTPSPEERLKVNLDRMAPGSATGFTRSARPVNPLIGSQARLPQRPPATGNFVPLGYSTADDDVIPEGALPAGKSASVGGVYATAVGNDSTAAEGATAVGTYASAPAFRSVVVGWQAASGLSDADPADYGTAIGAESEAIGTDSVALGHFVGAWTNSIAIGPGAFAGVAPIGGAALVTDSCSIAIGWGAQAPKRDSVALGRDASAGNDGDFVLGTTANTVVINTPLHTSAGAASGKYLPIRCGDAVIRLLPLYSLP